MFSFQINECHAEDPRVAESGWQLCSALELDPDFLGLYTMYNFNLAENIYYS